MKSTAPPPARSTRTFGRAGSSLATSSVADSRRPGAGFFEACETPSHIPDEKESLITVGLTGGIVVRISSLGLGVSEASRLTGIGSSELRARIRAGELPVIRIGRRLVIPVSRLVEWLHGAAQ